MIRYLFAELVITALVPNARAAGFDLQIPVAGGRIEIRDAAFIEGIHPFFSFTAVNQTGFSWRSVSLEFTITGTCNSKPAAWKVEDAFQLGYIDTTPVARPRRRLEIPLIGKVDGCRTDGIAVKLLEAQTIDGQTYSPRRTMQTQIDVPTSEKPLRFSGTLCNGGVPDLQGTITSETGWHDLKLKFTFRNGSAVENAHATVRRIAPGGLTPISLYLASLMFSGFKDCQFESTVIEVLSGESDTTRDTRLQTEADERERLATAAAEQERRDADLRKRRAAAAAAAAKKRAAEAQAADAEQARREREFCAATYRATANKKVAELTVKESQTIRACEARGLYAPI